MTTPISNLIIVGDKFNKFSSQNNVISVAFLLELLKSQSKRPTKQCYLLQFGQGINEEMSSILKTLIQQLKLSARFIVEDNAFIKRSNHQLTHKYYEQNILISDPVRLENNHFESYLMVDENCAELNDHVSGQHLQGMVLIEAARQMTIAVTEKYFITDVNRQHIGFVTNSLETHFHAFVFPISTALHYEIIQNRGITASNRSFKVKVRFVQNQQVATEIVYGFSIFDKVFIDDREDRAAHDAVNKIIHEQREKSYEIAA